MIPESGVFKFMPSSTGSKTDATTRTVREMIVSEAEARAKKTERLRAARLKRETIEAAQPATEKSRRKG